jgi:hypothetical protein
LKRNGKSDGFKIMGTRWIDKTRITHRLAVRSGAPNIPENSKGH